jgi:hypothetical protein
MIALAILVVAVRGSMVVDEEEEEPAALGAMVGFGRAEGFYSYFLCEQKCVLKKWTWQINLASPFDPPHPVFRSPLTNAFSILYPIPGPPHNPSPAHPRSDLLMSPTN